MSYVCVDDVEIAVQRVVERAIDEIRTVNPDVVRRRFPASLAALVQIVPICSRVDLYDNSGESLRWIARFDYGYLTKKGEPLLRWATDVLPQLR